MRAWLATCLLVGCASGRTAIDPPDAAVGDSDAQVWLDGSIELPVDAQTVVSIDAAIDAPPEVPPDAYECQLQNQQLLVNPVLDLSPTGMGWVQNNVDDVYPIITADKGIDEHTPPFKAWMGGWEATNLGVQSVTDSMYQDVTIPATTTALRLTGHYEVRTAELETAPYDTAQVALVLPDGTPLETVLSLSNGTPTTTWTAFDHAFASTYAGQTVRLRIITTNDVIEPTSFYFDTLALIATVCE